MKQLFIVAVATMFALACTEVEDAKKATGSNTEVTTDDPATLTSIQWIDSVKNYGKIAEGQQLQVSFRFKNTGDKPLVIKSVRPSCGCTAANPPDKPIAPGEEGTIEASFNSSGREGLNKKELTVEANTKSSQTHVLHFDVEVVKAAPAADNKQ